jgi:hypothetical protein
MNDTGDTTDASTINRPLPFRNVVLLSYSVFPGGSHGETLSPEQASVLMNLDATSVFFEQHYSQNIRTPADDLQTFGDAELRQQFRRQMDEKQRQFQIISHSQLQTCSTDPGLIWCHADKPTDNNALNDAISLITHIRSRTSERAALIVTAARGTSKTRDDSPATGFTVDEPVHHTPLWIDTGSKHPCRVQALSGSFDVLPTVFQMLTSDLLQTNESELAPRRCRSLCPLLTSPGLAWDREVLIKAENYSALRTKDFLIVREQAADNQPPESDREDRPLRLYLKPEDYWNVHDQAGAYQGFLSDLRLL